MEIFAIKVMTKEGDVHELGELWKNEVDVSSILDHPNIVQMVEHANEIDSFYIVTVMYTGSLLFDAVAGDDVFTETVAARYVKSMLEICEYLHSKGVVHRDLKPENFIFATRKPGAELVLLDFGVAKIVEDDKKYSDYRLGTPVYMSPELARAIVTKKKSLSGKSLKANDIWAVGVMAYVMLTGHQPFQDARSSIETFGAVMNEKILIPKEANLSSSCVDFLVKMLTRDGKKRIGLEKALEHEWLNGGADKEIHTNNLKALRQYSHQTRLKKAIISLLVEQTSPNSKKMQKMRSHFDRLDSSRTGKLDQKALQIFLNTQGFDEDDAKWESLRLLKEGDISNTGHITFDDFCHQFQRKEIKFNERYRRMVFNILDTDKSGFIERNELLPLLERLGGGINVSQLIAEVDKNHDSKLSWEEFESAMKEEVPDTNDLMHDGFIFHDFGSEPHLAGLVNNTKLSPRSRGFSAPAAVPEQFSLRSSGNLTETSNSARY